MKASYIYEKLKKALLDPPSSDAEDLSDSSLTLLRSCAQAAGQSGFEDEDSAQVDGDDLKLKFKFRRLSDAPETAEDGLDDNEVEKDGDSPSGTLSDNLPPG